MQSPVWKAFWTGFGALTFSQFLMSLTTMIDQFSAVSLGAGANATLGYATRLLALALGLLSTAIARAVLPVFSDAVASGNYRMAAQQARMWAGGLFIVCVVGLPLAWWLTPMAVSLLYERGAFSNQDTIAVAQVVRYGLLQVPFYVSAIVLIQLLLSQGKVKAMAAIALLSVAVKVVGNTLFAPMFGAAGIALATSLMYASSTIAFWLIALRRSDAI